MTKMFRMTLMTRLCPVSVLACLLLTTAAFGDDRPNILWITCEDISPNLGSYGDEFATTPTLDRLAERGVRMTNAYGNLPLPAKCSTR